MASRIFLVTKPEDCENINKLCEKLDNKGTKYEIDYLIYNRGKVIPFEVKSNKTSPIKSIELFKNKYSKVIGERYFIKSKPLKYGDNTTILPFYMLFCFK